MKSPFPGRAKTPSRPLFAKQKKKHAEDRKKSRKTGEIFLENRTNNTIYSVYKKNTVQYFLFIRIIFQ